MVKYVRHTGSFVAQAEDGSDRLMHVWTKIHDVGTFADPEAELRGLQELRTEDGQAVERLDKGKYQVVATGEILVSDDPEAP